MVFFDFNKANDSVPRNMLIQKLIKIRTPCNIAKLISNVLEIFILTICKEVIQIQRGLIQGSAQSSILFNLSINDHMIDFKNKDIESRPSDDIACIWPDMKQVKQAIRIMKDLCFKNEMRVNEDKSGILRILKQRGKIGEIENDLNIPEVNSYKFLGVQLD